MSSQIDDRGQSEPPDDRKERDEDSRRGGPLRDDSGQLKPGDPGHEKAILRKALPRSRGRRPRGRGKLKVVAAAVQKAYPNDPHRQVNSILAQAHIPAAFGTDRSVSDKTCTDYGRELHRAIDILPECGLPVRNVGDLDRKRVLALLRHWQSCGLKGKTVRKYVSTLRRFLYLIGQGEAVPTGEEWNAILRASNLAEYAEPCSVAAKVCKAWRALGVDPMVIIEAVRAVDPVVASQMELQLLFGLRANESSQIIPFDSDQGTHLIIWRGTKGGKERRIDFSTDPATSALQRAALDRARHLASLHPKRCLATPGRTLRATKNHMLYVARSHGVQKSDRGITLHGLRHQYACDLFLELTGLPAPVIGGVSAETYRSHSASIETALIQIARALGHERPSIVYAYTGNPFTGDHK